MSTEGAEHFDESIDVLVVGGGAGGFVGALTAHRAGLQTVLIEKLPVCGGSSLLSAGSIWIPNAPPLVKAGFITDREADLAYLETITDGSVARERLEAYLDQGPRMIDFLQRLSPYLTFEWRPGYPDYHPMVRGGSALGRSIEVPRIDRRKLRELDAELGTRTLPFPRGMWMRSSDLHTFLQLRQNFEGKVMFGRLVWRMVQSFLTRAKTITNGEALVARLRLAARDAGVPVRLNTALEELITDESGAVIGAVLRKNSGEMMRVRTRRGVLLASGGFEWNTEMRDRYMPIPTGPWSMGSRGNTGDGIRAGMAVGAAVDLMDDAWWMPGILWAPERAGMLLSERMVPGQIIVNGDGRRFTNEAAPYTDFVHDMIEGQKTGVAHSPAWMIIDDRSWRTYFIAGHLPIPPVPAPVPTGHKVPKEWLNSDGFVLADSIADLAAKTGLPEAGLRETFDRFNDFARRGMDDDFQRGTSPYDNYYGDVRLPNPNLRELQLTGPYYAFKVVPGDLGTKGGLLTDEFARVLDEHGGAITGLYAAGNTSASPMGHSYPGPGGTLGPAMTFSYVAANHMAGNRAKDRAQVTQAREASAPDDKSAR